MNESTPGPQESAASVTTIAYSQGSRGYGRAATRDDLTLHGKVHFGRQGKEKRKDNRKKDTISTNMITGRKMILDNQLDDALLDRKFCPGVINSFGGLIPVVSAETVARQENCISEINCQNYCLDGNVRKRETKKERYRESARGNSECKA